MNENKQIQDASVTKTFYKNDQDETDEKAITF